MMRKFHCYPDSDDAFDLLIGYPGDIKHEVEPEPDVEPVQKQQAAPKRRHRDHSHFAAIIAEAQRIGVDGKMFLASDVAATCKCPAIQVAKVLVFTDSAIIVERIHKRNYWRIKEDTHV